MKKIFLVITLLLLFQAVSFAQTQTDNSTGSVEKKSKYIMSVGVFGFTSIPVDREQKNYYDVGGGIGAMFKVNFLNWIALRTELAYNHNTGKTYGINTGIFSSNIKLDDYDVLEIRELLVFQKDTKINEAGLNPYIGFGPVIALGSHNNIGFGFIAGLSYNFKNNMYIGASLNLNAFGGTGTKVGNDTLDIGLEVGYRF